MQHNHFFNGMDADEMKHCLDDLADEFNSPDFVNNDPVSIPHRYTDKKDIECSGFLTATIAWGRRDLILRSAGKLMGMMGNEPYRFIMESTDKEIDTLGTFVHRTFNGEDAITFVRALRYLFGMNESLEDVVFEGFSKEGDIYDGITNLRKKFFSPEHSLRAERHIPDISAGSAAKKINMFFRWMVRNDENGVDFGLWEKIKPANLIIPLDLHAGNTARRLGLLNRRQNDRKSAEELTNILRYFDAEDPVKYDFALFGAGVNGVI